MVLLEIWLKNMINGHIWGQNPLTNYLTLKKLSSVYTIGNWRVKIRLKWHLNFYRGKYLSKVLFGLKPTHKCVGSTGAQAWVHCKINFLATKIIFFQLKFELGFRP